MAPLLGLGLFGVLPLPLALPLYLVVLVSSLLLYRAIHRAHRVPVLGGPERLRGSMGTIAWARPEGLIVRVNGEYWTADLSDAEGRIAPRLGRRPPEGTMIEVVGLRHNRLLVTPHGV